MKKNLLLLMNQFASGCLLNLYPSCLPCLNLQEIIHSNYAQFDFRTKDMSSQYLLIHFVKKHNLFSAYLTNMD